MRIFSLNPDSIPTFNYFTIIELILLFVCGYLFGITGLILIVILTTIFLYIFMKYVYGIGGSFANYQSKQPQHLKKDVIIKTLVTMFYSSYLSIGCYFMILFLKFDKNLNLLFYIWLSFLLVLFIIILLISIIKKNRIVKN